MNIAHKAYGFGRPRCAPEHEVPGDQSLAIDWADVTCDECLKHRPTVTSPGPIKVTSYVVTIEDYVTPWYWRLWGVLYLPLQFVRYVCTGRMHFVRYDHPER